MCKYVYKILQKIYKSEFFVWEFKRRYKGIKNNLEKELQDCICLKHIY